MGQCVVQCYISQIEIIHTLGTVQQSIYVREYPCNLYGKIPLKSRVPHCTLKIIFGINCLHPQRLLAE